MQKCPVCGREITSEQVTVGSCPSCGAPVKANLTPEPQITTPVVEPTPTPAQEPVTAQSSDVPKLAPAPIFPAQSGIESTPVPESVATQPVIEPTSAPEPVTAQSSDVPKLAPEPIFSAQSGIESTPVPEPTPTQPVIEPTPAQEPVTAQSSDVPKLAPIPMTPVQSGITQEMPAPAPAPLYGNTPTMPQYQPPMPQYVPPAMPVQAPPKQNTGMIVGIIVAVVIILLGGLIALYALGKSGSGPLASLGPTATATFTPTPTITPTPTQPPVPTIPAPGAGFTAFSASDGSYGLNYPQSWTTTSQNISQTNTNLEIFASSDGNSLFGVFPFGTILPADSQMQFLQGFLQGVKGQNVKIDANTQTKTIGSNTWTTLGFTFTDSGTDKQGTLYSTDHGSQTYLLFDYAPTTSFTQIDSQSFQSMLKSFTFLK